MLTLAAADTIAGSADAATDVTYTIFGDAVTTGDAYQVLAQGQLPSSAATIYTVPGSTAALISAITFSNQSAGARTITLYRGGTAAANALVSFVIPANGSATYDGRWLQVRDSNGAPLTGPLFSQAGAVNGNGMVFNGSLWLPGGVSRGVGTPATAAQSLTASSANLVTGTLVALTTGQLVVGSRFRFTIGLIKTAAGVATWAAAVKFGTNGSTADAAIATWTSGTNTGAIDQATLTIEMVVATTGGSATANCTAFYVNTLTNVTGLGVVNFAPSPTASFNSAAASPFLHVDITPGASAVMTSVGMADQIA